MAIYRKVLLYQGDLWALSTGCGVIIPTADGTSLTLSDATSLLAIDNEAVYLQPFLGFIVAPSDRLFIQGFGQFDFAANGNPLAVNTTGSGLTYADKLTDANHAHVDLGLGYWLYRNDCESASGVTGIIPMLELNYTKAPAPATS